MWKFKSKILQFSILDRRISKQSDTITVIKIMLCLAFNSIPQGVSIILITISATLPYNRSKTWLTNKLTDTLQINFQPYASKTQPMSNRSPSWTVLMVDNSTRLLFINWSKKISRFLYLVLSTIVFSRNRKKIKKLFITWSEIRNLSFSLDWIAPTLKLKIRCLSLICPANYCS